MAPVSYENATLINERQRGLSDFNLARAGFFVTSAMEDRIPRAEEDPVVMALNYRKVVEPG